MDGPAHRKQSLRALGKMCLNAGTSRSSSGLSFFCFSSRSAVPGPGTNSVARRGQAEPREWERWGRQVAAGAKRLTWLQ